MLFYLQKNFYTLCLYVCVCVCVCVCLCGEWGAHLPLLLYGADCQICVDFTQTFDGVYVMKWLTLKLVLTFIS